MRYIIYLILFISTQLISQDYYVVKNIGMDDSEFVYDAPSHQIHFQGSDDGLNQDEIFTDWQTLPFDWEFYGEQVSGYYISENGYITFDKDAEKVSLNDNTTLPSSTGPKNAIYVFWDDLVVNNAGESASGTFTDRMFTWTFGQAPNRTHIVMWQNFALKVNDRQSYIYGVLAIHEGADFWIAHMNAKNLSDATATVGIQNKDLSKFIQIEGSPDYNIVPFLNPGHADDIVYRFFKGEQLDYDINILEHYIEPTVTVNEEFLINGKLDNLGSSTIESFDLNYEINGDGNTFTDQISGVSIMPGDNYEFEHLLPYAHASAGELINVRLWTSNINNNEDENPSNNELEIEVLVNLGIKKDRNVLVEEGTGAWCGYCPGGSLVLTQMSEQFGERIVPVAYHTNDAMVVNSALAVVNEYIGSFPSALIDRKPFGVEEDIALSNYNEWETYYQESLSTGSPMNIDIEVDYDQNSRLLDIQVNGDFDDYVYGDLRMTCMLVRDVVTGQGTGYDQVNYFSSEGGSAGGVNHPYYNLPDPILNYEHRHVASIWLVQDSWGNAFWNGKELYTIGSTYNQKIDITLPVDINPSNAKIVAFFSYYDVDEQKRSVINATEIAIPFSSSSKPIGGLQQISMDVFPNPTTEKINIYTEEKINRIELCNEAGQTIETISKPLEHAGGYSLNIKNHSSGTYFLRIFSDEGVSMKKIIKI